MDKRKGLTLMEVLVVLGIIGIIVALTFLAVQNGREAAERTQEKEAWLFEKYFEDRGNGVYHLEWDDIIQQPFNDPPAVPTQVRTTQELATVIGEWRKYHPELRIVAIMHIGQSSIIFTERR